MIATLVTTMKLLTDADSLMPITRIVVQMAMMNSAGRLMSAPVRLRPVCAQPAICAVTFAAVHHTVGDVDKLGGRSMPTSPSRDTRWPDHPTATVEAPAAYSSTRSHPITHAT